MVFSVQTFDGSRGRCLNTRPQAACSNTFHRRNQEIEMYTHISGVDHEQGFLSLVWGVRGPSPEKKLIFGMAGERF